MNLIYSGVITQHFLVTALPVKVDAHDDAYFLSVCEAGKQTRTHTAASCAQSSFSGLLWQHFRGNGARAPASHSSLHQSEQRDDGSVFFMNTKRQK